MWIAVRVSWEALRSWHLHSPLPLTPAEYEKRRLVAAERFDQDELAQAAITRLVGMSRRAVHKWHTTWKNEGPAALTARHRHFAGQSKHLPAESLHPADHETDRERAAPSKRCEASKHFSPPWAVMET